jgi:hypothetical protein
MFSMRSVVSGMAFRTASMMALLVNVAPEVASTCQCCLATIRCRHVFNGVFGQAGRIILVGDFDADYPAALHSDLNIDAVLVPLRAGTLVHTVLDLRQVEVIGGRGHAQQVHLVGGQGVSHAGRYGTRCHRSAGYSGNVLPYRDTVRCCLTQILRKESPASRPCRRCPRFHDGR